MKMHELNAAELQEVNGGTSSNSSSEGGILGSLGIGNLLSYSSSSKNGDQSQSTSFSLGNGISSAVGGMFGNGSSSLF
jgi:hypothetical protein